MRIVLASRTSEPLGGVEEYVRRLAAALQDRHELAFFFERGAAEHQSVAEEVRPIWLATRDGVSGALAKLNAWQPDIVYCQGLDSPETEASLAQSTKSVYSCHGYFGTCISGHKMHAFPSPQICRRQMGPACLAYYLPRRCGGLSPVTMLQAYRLETLRLATIRKYSAVVVHSRHMQQEYTRHGITSTVVPLPIGVASASSRVPLTSTAERHLVFIGRLVDLKGCEILLNAAVHAARSLPALRLTIAGEGNERESLERHAGAVASAAPNLSVRFVGWVNEAKRDTLFAEAHAVVVPSIWPEPFGMVGLEAAAFGVPAVAFNVGGIADWLRDGFSGCLAEPPTSIALAKAIGECVGDPATHARLSQGALAVHAEFGAHDTVEALEQVFAKLLMGAKAGII